MHQQLTSISLTRLAYLLFGMSIVSDGYNNLGGVFLGRRPNNDSAHVWAAAYGYEVLVLIFFSLMIITILLAKPLGLPPTPPSTSIQSSRRPLRDITFGFLAGIVAFLISIPVLFPSDSGVRFVAQAIYFPLSIGVVVKLLWIFIAIPIVTEIVFKGMVLQTLTADLSLPAAILLSSLLFAHFWPLFNALAGFILGVISALVYSRSRNVVSPVIANIIFTALSGSFVLYRVLSRH